MKTLLILRHAKSSWDDPTLEDHERPLTKRGRRDAPRMGKVLREENMLPDLIFSSSAVRARVTAELVAGSSGYKGEILLSDEMYAASPEAYIAELAKIPEPYACVMVVGHNPGLEELLSLLTGEVHSLPTAALARVDLPIQQWEELSAQIRGKLVGLWKPKEL